MWGGRVKASKRSHLHCWPITRSRASVRMCLPLQAPPIPSCKARSYRDDGHGNSRSTDDGEYGPDRPGVWGPAARAFAVVDHDSADETVCAEGDSLDLDPAGSYRDRPALYVQKRGPFLQRLSLPLAGW